MDPTLLLIALSTAAAVSLLTTQGYSRLTTGRRLVSSRIASDAPTLIGGQSSVLRARRTSARVLSVLPMSAAAQDRLTRELSQAGMALRASEYLWIRVWCALTLGGLALLLLPAFGVEGPPRALLPLAFALAGWLLPRMYVSRRRKKRLETIEKQLPDALTAMSKALRAGAGLLQALAHAADETPAPLGPELQGTLRDLQLGGEAEDIFTALSERIGSADLNIALTAIIIQRTVGGNLSEILNNVTHTIRERAKIEGEIKVLTSRQRLTANLISALPFLVAGAFLLVNREMGTLLVGTTIGQVALAFSLLLELSGIWLIRKLGVIEI